MKESRLIIIISIIGLILLLPLYYILKKAGIDLNLIIAIITNFLCATIVALITAICNFQTSKRRIASNVYTLYFDIYRTYYYIKNYTRSNLFFKHYNVDSIFKKINEISLRLAEILGEYHGLFGKEDHYYRKFESKVTLNENLKTKNIGKSRLKINNAKEFNSIIIPMMNEIEKILQNINKKRFNKDVEDMTRIFNHLEDVR